MTKREYDASDLSDLLLPGVRGAAGKICPDLETYLVHDLRKSPVRIVAINPKTGQTVQEVLLDKAKVDDESRNWRDSFGDDVRGFCKRAKASLT